MSAFSYKLLNILVNLDTQAMYELEILDKE